VSTTHEPRNRPPVEDVAGDVATTSDTHEGRAVDDPVVGPASPDADGGRREPPGVFDWMTGRRPPAPIPPAPGTDRWSVVRLLAVVGAVVGLAVALGATDLLIVIVVIIAMVMLHELGHFATAKWSKMLVTQYFVGFGPTLWSVRRGETEYGVKAIPAGGFVKIPGMTNLEEVDPAIEERTYRQQPFHKRIIVTSAGSAMHFLIALVLAWVALVAFGSPSSHGVEIGGFVHWQGHQENAAQQAGLRPGDVIVSANGHAVTAPTQLSNLIKSSADHPVHLVVDRKGKNVDLTVVPALGRTDQTTGAEVLGPGKGAHGIIGVNEQQPFAPVGPLPAIGSSFSLVGHITAATVAGLGHVFSPHGLSSLYNDVTSSKAANQAAQSGNRPSSIVGATSVATQALQLGVYYLLLVLIALNIVIGIINMLPMLPLDGGHVAIAVYERIRTRRGQRYYVADVTKLLPVVYAFVAVLALIVVSSVYLDIAHPIHLH